MKLLEVKNKYFTRNIKKYMKWFFIFLVAIIFFEFLRSFLYGFDKDKSRVEHFLLKNDLVFEKVGSVKNISFRSVLSFNGDFNSAPYKEYLYNVEGINGNTFVQIKFDKSCNKSDECFKVSFR